RDRLVSCFLMLLTLLALKVRGFLVLRHTLQLSILAAILKPKARRKLLSVESKLDNPRGSLLPKRNGTL
ncbi:MAG: hypothetical protein RIM23_28075, partial [Coleofasciculus sp. G3-WIS-01]|uniref:hypothetical protein n=1 Tax=Coleofasciculus sp. G3-WIS-01 TaxID=3069528 RepID=UPI003304F27D